MKEGDVSGVKRAVRFLTGMVAVIAMLVGMPALLVAAAGWPLPTYVPKPADVILAIEQSNIPSSFVLKALAFIGWLVWAQFAWATLWETVVNMRRVSRGGDATPAPLVPTKLHNATARLLASLLTATVVTGTTASSMALAGPISSSTFVPVTVDHLAATSSRQSPMADESTAARWRVAKDDSLWSIAQTALGDGSRVGEIIEMNSFLDSPRAVRAGMVLQLPADANVPTDRSSSSFVPDGVDEEYVPESTVTIVRGDTLWDLSEARVELTGDLVASPRETLDYLHLVVDANPDVVEDPNLIHPGEVFVMPAIGEAPVVIDIHDAHPTGAQESAPEFDDPTAPQPDVGGIDAPSAPTVTPPVVALPVVTSPPAEMPPSSVTSAPDASASSSSIVLKLGLSTVLSGGVLALVRRAIQRRAARGRSRTKALARLDLAQGVLARRQYLTLHEWAAAHLFRAAEYIATKDLAGAPVAVELSPEGIEVLWDEPNMTCLEPFQVIDGGWSWQAAYDGEADTPEAPPEVVAPALVTVGIREGRSLLVDLEAFGAVSVIGDAHAAESLVRSIALELATGEQLSNAYVSLVGFDLGLDRHLPRVQVRTEAEAFRHLAEMSRMQRRVLSDGEMRTTFHLRGVSPAGREASVVVVRAETCAVLPSLLNLATPRSGVVVIILSDTAMTETVIEVEADATGSLARLGLDFEAAQIESSTTDELAVVIEAIEDPADEDLDVVATSFELPEPTPAPIPAMPTPEPPDCAQVVDEAQPDRQGRLDLAFAETDLTVELEEWPRPDLLVRVLGRPRVEHDAKLSQLEISLVAYLACRGGSVPTEDILDAVWKGALIDRRTMFNRLSKIRPKLGGFVAPIAKTDSTVRLEGVVVTDLQLLQDFVERSKGESSGEAMQLLRAGLDLVEGPPFDGPMFEWAYTLQLHSAALALIREAVLALVDLALDSGDFKLARTAVAAGLRSARLSDELYQARMRVEAAAGNPAGVREAYNELVLLLDELDGGYEPHEDTQRLLAELVAKRLSA